jgi:hypothetical protein
MKMYVIKRRQAEIYIPNGGGFVYSVAQAKVFPSLAVANGYRMQNTRLPDAFVVCELSADGQITPIVQRTCAGVSNGSSR